VIDGKKQGKIHTNADLQDLGDKLLPRAIEYLHQNSESKMYQMSLKSRHGTAHLCVENATIEMQTPGKVRSEATRRAQNKRETTLQEHRERWKQLSDNLLRLWIVPGSDKLHGSIMDTRNSA
jgi:predicted metal-dependent hydrolase